MSSVNLGYIEGKISKWDGITALFDWKLSPEQAVKRFFTSSQKKQPPFTVRITPVHLACFSPTGGGKGVSLVIPSLLSARESTVTTDFKGENYQITAKARRRMGHRVVCLDPFNLVGGTDTFNPLEFIDPDDPNAHSMCKSLANAFYPRTGKESDPFWISSAENTTATIIGFVVCFADPERKNMQTVREVLCDQARFEGAIKICCRATEWGGMLARGGHATAALEGKTLSGVMATIHQFMSFMDVLALAASMKTSSFNPAELINGKMDVYCVIPPKHMKTNSALLRMWLGSFLDTVMQGGLQESRKVRFLIDEAASVGRMDVMDDALDKGRGYGIRLMLMYQSIGQLEKCWGADGGVQTLLSNCTTTFFGVNDLQTAEHVSSRLGEFTNIVSSGGTNTGVSSSATSSSSSSSHTSGSSSGSNEGWNQVARRLLQASEVMQLDPRQAITFHPGVPPIMTFLRRYYESYAENNIPFIKAAFNALCCLGAASIPAIVASMLVFRSFN